MANDEGVVVALGGLIWEFGMRVKVVAWSAVVVLLMGMVAGAEGLDGTRMDGYRGIWFTLGQKSKWGDKYSGGLGTYCANHLPISIYSPKAEKTFFVYGGTVKGERHLLIMASYYDHKSGRVPRPVVVYDKQKVNDPHDNGAISIDDEGYLWVFVSGRARARPGLLFRSVRPYDVGEWEQIEKREMTYPQPHYVSGKGFFYLFTKYTKGRELYWRTSTDGRMWTEDHKLVGFGGHYQVSNVRDGLVATTFMWHPGGNVDKRTNLYYAQTKDWGATWQTVEGKELKTPLDSEKNPALLIDYQAQGLNVYIHDLSFDDAGRPIILYLTSRGAAPGPENGPYTWRVTHYTDTGWETNTVAESDHNYDTGALYVDERGWTVIGPTGAGPQAWGAGGEMVMHRSTDSGKTWKVVRPVTESSARNQSYARRPLGAHDPFYCFWADGDPGKFTESHLYFCDSEGKRVYELPYDMDGDEAEPKVVGR